MRLLLAADIRGSLDPVVDQAIALARRVGATLDVVHVDPFGAYRPATRSANLREALTAALEEQSSRDQADLQAVLDRLPPQQRGQAVLCSGDPLVEILSTVEGGRYDALLVGPAGRPGLRLGSVAYRLVRRAPVTVVVVRDADHPHGHLLAAIDVHDTAEPIVDAAGRWARALATRVDLLFVREEVPQAPILDAEVLRWMRVEHGRAGDRAEALLRGLVERLPPDVRGEVVVALGGKAETIVDHAARHAGVVVGTRGRTGLARLVLGSVADGVVRGARCPTFVLRVD